jgi:hypothetical protein
MVCCAGWSSLEQRGERFRSVALRALIYGQAGAWRSQGVGGPAFLKRSANEVSLTWKRVPTNPHLVPGPWKRGFPHLEVVLRKLETSSATMETSFR